MTNPELIGSGVIKAEHLPDDATVLVLHNSGQVEVTAKKTEKVGVSLFVAFGLKNLLTEDESLAIRAIKSTEDYLERLGGGDDLQTETDETGD